MMQQKKDQQKRTAITVACVVVGLFLLMGLNYFSSAGAAKNNAEAETNTSAPPVADASKTFPDIVKPGDSSYTPDIDYSTHPEETMARMRKCARDSKGDFSKLSAKDQFMFDTVTGGAGRAMFRSLVQHPENHLEKP